MRLLGLILLLSPCTLAQSGFPYAACGNPVAGFKVSHDKTQHPTPSPQGGNAMLYVLGSVNFAGAETVALGIDGTWVGAVNNNAYFSVPITPGQHHLCARLSGRAMTAIVGPANQGSGGCASFPGCQPWKYVLRAGSAGTTFGV